MSTPGYAIVDMPARAEAALSYHRMYVDEKLRDYTERLNERRRRGIPTLAILGNGRAGKDEAAAYICSRTGLTYGGSSSTSLCRFVSHMLGMDYETAWAERHAHREFWIAAGNAVRSHDLTLLCRLALGLGDFAVGLRGRHEIYGCKKAGVVDALVWIERDVPADPTMELGMADCDIVIPNFGSYVELYRKLDTFIELTGLTGSKENAHG